MTIKVTKQRRTQPINMVVGCQARLALVLVEPTRLARDACLVRRVPGWEDQVIHRPREECRALRVPALADRAGACPVLRVRDLAIRVMHRVRDGCPARLAQESALDHANQVRREWVLVAAMVRAVAPRLTLQKVLYRLVPTAVQAPERHYRPQVVPAGRTQAVELELVRR